MTPQHEILDFYAQPGVMTDAGEHAPTFDALPRDIAALVRVAQGLQLHEHIALAYGVTLTDERRCEVHLRSNKQRLDCLLARDQRPLELARPVEERLVGNCRHISLLMVAMLRSQRVPARARCGFGGYFEPGQFADHWVCEYWNSDQRRWVLVDAQIDELQRGLFKPDFDLLDVPRNRFLIAGDAWVRCRADEMDPAKFGILNMRGLWFISGNLVRDAASLNNMEMLPWDVWGAMAGPDGAIDGERIAFLDRLATLTHDPDSHFAELRQLYEDDERLRVPTTVFNAVLNRSEAI